MAKRKADPARARKKAKGDGKSESGTSEPKPLSQKEISDLAQQVTQGNYNSLAPLLEQLPIVYSLLKLENEKAETAGRHAAMALFKAFQRLLSEKTMEGTEIVAKWLQDKYARFQQILLDFLRVPLEGQSLQLDCLDIYLALMKAEASAKNEFPVAVYQDLVQALLYGTIGSVLADESSLSFILAEFLEKYFKYWDLQNYFFDKTLVSSLEQQNEEKGDRSLVFANFYTVVKEGLLYTPDFDALRDCRTWVRIPLSDDAYKFNFKTRFQKCFLEVMKLVPLSAKQYKALLSILHKRVIPYMGSPASLMDFLTDAYDQEEDLVVPILALNSLYELMKNYNLEYPDFYTKLYLMLTPEMLLTRYRSRFFRLCDLFLSSTHLAASLVASFIKRLARLALTAAAPGVVIIIPFIYNVLKRHPTCMVLLQNTQTEFTDTFLNEEKDPLKTGAMGSSLWELETLMSHYHPNVATLAKIFGEPFRKPSYNMEDFLDWSYLTLLEAEKARKYKGMALLEYEEYDTLFAGGEKLYISWSL